MYTKRGVGVGGVGAGAGAGSKTEMSSRVSHNEDLKRIKEALDKRDRSSPSTCRIKDNNNNNIIIKDEQQQRSLSILSAPTNKHPSPTGCCFCPPFFGFYYGFGCMSLDYIPKLEESETDSEDSDVSGSDTSWISWFCNLRGNESLCEVDDDYIQDDFNLCGLSNQVPYYDYALDLILDVESSHGDTFTEEQNELIESAAEMLYGLIHVRYILTTKGQAAMLEKYKNAEFGRCPRVYCCGQPCLPVGQSDIPRHCTLKIYCPKCEDIYTPRSRFQDNLDGAYFGTTFPHLFLMTYGHLKPQKTSQTYVPRVFGFKVHKP